MISSLDCYESRKHVRRLETLILQAVEQQRTQCAYHNTRTDSQVSAVGDPADDILRYAQVSSKMALQVLLLE